MALNGADKETRSIPSPLGYNPVQIQNQIHHLQPQDRTIQEERAALNLGRSKTKAASGATAARSSTRYRECLKNHAANVGGNVTDGCGEFMPSGEEGTLEALKCAACDCHRNFHRKETRCSTDAAAIIMHPFQLSPPSMISPNINQRRNDLGTHHWTSMTAVHQPVKMAFGGGGSGSIATDSSSDQELNYNAYQSNTVAPPPFVLSKKRSRTKFTQEQKDKMLEYAEKLGWRIPREDDVEVQRFCGEVGVKRQVFKIWMHNNKNSASKKNSLELL